MSELRKGLFVLGEDAREAELRALRLAIALFKDLKRGKGGRPKSIDLEKEAALRAFVDSDAAAMSRKAGRKIGRREAILKMIGRRESDLTVKEQQELKTLLNRLAVSKKSRKPKAG